MGPNLPHQKGRDMIRFLRRLVPILVLSVLLPLTAPTLAEEPETEGFSLMEEGAKLLLRGLMAEMEPALDEMEKALEDAAPMLEELGPQLSELLNVIGDLRNYQPPEVLENGDILIRRKTPLPDALKQDPGPTGEIEL